MRVSTSRNGTLDFARGYGLADVEHDVPITPRTPLYPASVSKQFTVAAINLLAAEGKLSSTTATGSSFPSRHSTIPRSGSAI